MGASRNDRLRGSFRPADQALTIGILLAALSAAFLLNILHVGDEPMLSGVFLALASALVLLHRAGMHATDERLRELGARLDRTDADRAISAADAEQRHARELTDVRKAHDDLMAHHRYTKRMLQARRPEDVFEALLQGVREGLGFADSVIGIRDERGDIVFRPDGGAREEVRLPAWDASSPIAASFWNMQQLVIAPADPAIPERDRRIAGDGPAFAVPVVRRPNKKCSEAKQCGLNGCLSFDEMNPRCWSMSSVHCVSAPNASPDEKRRVCSACEMFAPAGVLVVRRAAGGRAPAPGDLAAIVSLAGEAGMALEYVELFENLRTMSVTDGLTGLTNHREFYAQLRKELERARRYGSTVSVLIIDVDDFKRFNDRYGHLAGDLALKKIAELLRSCSRGSDVVARYGGEEFALILPESTAGGALMVAERIKTDIGGHDFLPCAADAPVHLTVSIGIFSSEGGIHSEDQVVSFADEAAYQAKFAGKNRVMVKGVA